MAAASVLFGAWQSVMPPDFVSVRGLNPLAVTSWQAALGWQAPVVPLAVYTSVFRGLLALLGLGYGGLVWFVYRGGRLTFRPLMVTALATVVALALAMPPSLSTDVFAYVGYGRLQVVHGLNPHLFTQADLVRLGDPTAPYLHWPISSPYGPMWTLLSMAIVGLAPDSSVWGPVMAMKAMGGAALIAAAYAARAIVARVGADVSDRSNRADGVFALVAFNPVLLIEGPGNGHNDLAMMAFLMGGFTALAHRRPTLASLLIGTAAAIKLLPLLVVPWLVVLAARAAPANWSARVTAVVAAVCIALAPVVLSAVPFWAGARTLGGLTDRWKSGGGAVDQTPPSARADDPGEQGSATVLRNNSSATRSNLIARAWPAAFVYLWALLVLCLGRGESVFRVATVWTVVSLAVMLFVAGLWFPWYLAWMWPAVVLRFSRLHLALMIFLWPFSMLLLIAYSWPPSL